MRKSKFALPGIALSLLLAVAPLSASAAAKAVTVDTQAITMKFDGQTLALPTGQAAFTYQSRVYIPLRFVSYALQKNVVWDGTKATVTVVEPTSSQAVVLKEYLMNSAATAKANGGKSAATGKIKVTPVNVKFLFDGSEKKLPEGQQAFSLNGTIYVPVRFISESAGTAINWDSKTGSVIGQSKGYQGSNGTGGNSGSGNGTGGGTTGEGDGTSAGGGGATTPKTVDEIAAQTEKTLETMRDSCIESIIDLVGVYEGDKLIEQANRKLASCQTKFESTVKSAETKLKAAGATDAETQTIIQGYRDTYNAEIKKWRELAEQYLGIKL